MNGTLEDPIVYLISKGEANPLNFDQKKEELLNTIRAATEAGIDLIQIREKNLTSRLLCDLTEAAAAITRESGTRLLVNGRADIALAAGADGVHLPADGLSADVIRRSFPAAFLIGVSIHSAAEGTAAKLNGADFVCFGPVFASPGKDTPQGLEALREVCALVEPFPVIAVGGIDVSNYRMVLESGSQGFAAIRFLNETANLRKELHGPITRDE